MGRLDTALPAGNPLIAWVVSAPRRSRQVKETRAQRASPAGAVRASSAECAKPLIGNCGAAFSLPQPHRT